MHTLLSFPVQFLFNVKKILYLLTNIILNLTFIKYTHQLFISRLDFVYQHLTLFFKKKNSKETRARLSPI